MFVGQEEKHLKDDANGEVVENALRDERRPQTIVDVLERGTNASFGGARCVARIGRRCAAAVVGLGLVESALVRRRRRGVLLLIETDRSVIIEK